MSETGKRPFWFLRRRAAAIARDVDDEIRAHLEMRIAELRASGFSDEDARREAVRRFGDLDATRDYCRRQDRAKEENMGRALALGDLLQDVKIALRGLVRAKGLAAVIVATVGLGIGATTIAFGAVYTSLLRPLPYDAPERLVRVFTDSPPNKFPLSVVDYRALEAQQTRFERMAGYTARPMAWTDGVTAERLRGRVVTPGYFEVLGLRPALGRAFIEAEGRPGSPATVIVSHAFWKQRLGGRADAIGSAVRLDGADHTVVGVLPPSVGPLEQGVEFFVPAQWDVPRRRGPFFVFAIGKLRDAAGTAAAADELRALNRALFPLWRDSYQDQRATWAMMSLDEHIVGRAGRPATVALAAVALVWLIACANASSLLVARVSSRQRELAVRAALGASRARVLRHLLVESALLAAGSALVGIALAAAGLRLLATVGAAYVPRAHEVALQGPVLWVLAVLTLASAALFGLVPALSGTGAQAGDTLRSLGRSATASLSVRRARRLLVAGQFAIATPLLVGAALLLASLDALARVDLGFDGRRVVSGSISLPAARYPDYGQVAGFWEEAERRLAAIPGVEAVAFANGRPPSDVQDFNNFDLEDLPTPPGGSQPVTPWVAVTRDYFRLAGLRLVEGRLFDEHDGRTDASTVVVDRAWALRFFPGGSAIGRRFRSGGCTDCPWTTVVGVVSEVKYAGLDQPDQGTVYTPMVARTETGPVEDPSARFRYALVRTSGDPATALPAVRQALRELDPTIPLSSAATMDELVARALDRPRSLSFLVTGFALIALALSVVGIYGVMAYFVQQHAKDIGIRMALGGRPKDVLRLVVGQAMRVVAGGVAVGLCAAFALARLMGSLLFGVAPTDTSAYAAVAAALVAAALAACAAPAARALRVRPALLLRAE